MSAEGSRGTARMLRLGLVTCGEVYEYCFGARHRVSQSLGIARQSQSPSRQNGAVLTSRDLKAFVPLDTDSESLLRMALSELNLSARAYDRILKVSRTIADLAGDERVDSTHISEAIQYRTLDRQVWG
jgi:magnesium chelatase family protein